MKKFIFFRSDRMGDFILLTNIIKNIKKKYNNSHITIVCSKLNYNLVKKYKIIDKIFIYNKDISFSRKISLINKIISNNYFASFAVDGKSFSNLCNLLIKARYKLGLVYKYKFFNFWLTKPNFFYNYFVLNKFESFTSKKDLENIEHLPSKIRFLGNFFKLNIKTKDKYYFEVSSKEELNFKKYHLKNIKKKYVLIHLDEKWNDIKFIESKLFSNLLILQKKINKKIVITSYNNKFKYFKNLNKNILKSKSNNNLVIIKNSNLFFFERLINHSFCSISCHSGFLAQVAGTNSTKIIDIINKNDYKWYSCWIPKNTVHKFIFKSNNNNFFSIDKIFKNLSIQIKSFKSF